MANNESAPKGVNVVSQVRTMLEGEKVKARMAEMLGNKSPQFITSVVNTVNASAQLQKCEPTSIMAAVFVAASFDLPIDPNLGFAAIVPYKAKRKEGKQWVEYYAAQFQLMYKGIIQLAWRTGEYERMSCSEIYADELISYNPIKCECEFVTDFSNCTQRELGDSSNIVGYYAWFKLKNGGSQELYMTKQQVMNHARKYSQSYRYDLNDNKKSSRWSTDFDAMAKKTVIKLLLSKWGILSIQMQTAIQEDQKIYDNNGESSYADNQPDVIEAVDPFEGHAIEEKEETKAEKKEEVNNEQTQENEFAAFEQQFENEELPFK